MYITNSTKLGQLYLAIYMFSVVEIHSDQVI